MTYRASWDLAPSRPLSRSECSSHNITPSQTLQAFPCLRTFAPALPSTGMLSSSPPTGSLSLMSQLIGHLVRSQAPPLQALWSTYSCFIFFSWPCILFGYFLLPSTTRKVRVPITLFPATRTLTSTQLGLRSTFTAK